MSYMRQQWTDYRLFFREFRTTFHTTGAVLPSGRALGSALARYVRERPAGSGRQILEVGPGTGAVTRHIVDAMGEGDQLKLVERNAEFVSRLAARLKDDPRYQPLSDRIALRHAGVEELDDTPRYDVIVSGLPLNNFSVEFVEQILAKFARLLKPGGTLSFFEYVAIRRFKALIARPAERARLAGVARLLGKALAGNELRRDCVWTNVPPAWVHHVQSNGQAEAS